MSYLAKARVVMRERGCSFGEACAVLGRRGGCKAARNRKLQLVREERAEVAKRAFAKDWEL